MVADIGSGSQKIERRKRRSERKGGRFQRQKKAMVKRNRGKKRSGQSFI